MSFKESAIHAPKTSPHCRRDAEFLHKLWRQYRYGLKALPRDSHEYNMPNPGHLVDLSAMEKLAKMLVIAIVGHFSEMKEKNRQLRARIEEEHEQRRNVRSPRSLPRPLRSPTTILTTTASNSFRYAVPRGVASPPRDRSRSTSSPIACPPIRARTTRPIRIPSRRVSVRSGTIDSGARLVRVVVPSILVAPLEA